MSNRTDSDSAGMQLMLLNEEKGELMTLWLPKGEAMGRYSFEQYGIDSFYIEAYQGYWHVVCKSESWIFDQSGYKSDYVLEDKSFIKIVSGKKQYGLFAEIPEADNRIFHKHYFGDTDMITIGRAEGNDIRIAHSMVSGRHAVIRKIGEQWELVDMNSTNGTYVNNKKILRKTLQCGDLIYIIGAKLIFGIGFFAINLSGERVYLNPAKFRPMGGMTESSGNRMEDTIRKNLFNRLPRRRMALTFDAISVDAPPMSANSNKMPLLLRMGSSMVMGTTAMLAGNITSVLTSLFFPLMTNRYTEKEKKEYEERRKQIYSAYLSRKKTEIEQEREKEETVLKWNYPSLNETLDIPGYGTRLWERKKTDDDFLTVRIGVGDKKLLAKIVYPVEQMGMEEDELEKRMRELVETPVMIRNIPIQSSLTEDYVCGVSGLPEQRIQFIRNLILQLVTFHSYDEVKIVFLGNEGTLDQLNFVRYLPHIWNDERNFRFLATESPSAYQISEYLKKELEGAKIGELKDILKHSAYYVVFALDKKCFDSMEFLKEMIQEDTTGGISVIAAFDDLPKECSKIFNLSPNGEHEVIFLKQLDREIEKFALDDYDESKARISRTILYNAKLKNIDSSYALPKMMTFLEMFGVGRIEYLNIENRWKTSNPVQSLATPIGVGTDGSVFMLDLHQKFQGPHGLVAGTTGSGKSEFLLTYILSLAVNYDPDEVTFVLIDYKGGGLAGAFDDPEHGVHLPHLVGTITNLDGSAIQRSLIAIQSELLRRQRIFNEVKSATEEGTMDIYTYQKLYRSGVIKEPLPHLFIISDEFAELKQQEPEFMEKLISAARIGRSLGIHLILATQKPSGVVNDQIRSNTKFRVCLKVQDKADSQDMLMRPEAAELKDTGRFYLQVGYNEFFALGQSAWSGAVYTPQNEVAVQRDESVEIIDETGQTVSLAKKKYKTGAQSGTQLVAVVKYISAIADKRGRAVRQIWKPALPEILIYSEFIKQNARSERTLESYLGMVDDPENQAQFPLKANLVSCNNILVIGEIASGKTTLLQTLLFDITAGYGPEQINYYIIDCSNHSLRAFKDAPHCGAWLTEDDENDISRLFELFDRLIKERKQLFAKENVSDYVMYTKRKVLPLLLIVIDNAAGLTATKNGDKYYTTLGEYMKLCSGLGIQFIITASSMNELYSKTKQEMGTRITLGLKDKYSYGDVLNAKCQYLPAKTAGRGLVVADERALEFQTAIVADACLEKDDAWLKQEVDRVCGAYGGQATAERLPMPDKNQEYSEFCRNFSKGRIPLGYSLTDMRAVALPLKQLGMLSVYFGCEDGIRPLFGNFIHAAEKNGMELVVIRRKEKSIFHEMEDLEQSDTYECSSEEIERFILKMTEISAPRIRHLQEYTRAHGLKASRKDIYQDTYPYMSSTLPSILVLIENLYDVTEEMGNSSDEILAKLFSISRNIGIYYIAGFYPGERINSAYVCVKAFNPDRLELYFGGRYDRQFMGNLPSKLSGVTEITPYNSGIAKYKDKIYPLLMPCGELVQAEKDEDDRDIF